MKIAILSTPWIAVPPEGYGGIELVVANLTEGLVKKGHQVMLFATGDSKTSARLEYKHQEALGNDWSTKQNPYPFLNHLHKFFKIVKEEKFTIIHNNAQYIPQYFLDLQDTPFINTLHGAFYKSLIAPSGLIKDKRETLIRFKNHPYISISNNQRMGIPNLNYVKTVYNGIKINEFSLGKGNGNYLAWLGRITPNKGIDIAIKVAKKANLPLKISAFVDSSDQKYFDEQIKPQIGDNIEIIPQIKNNKDKNEFLGNALATLFPIRWHEPFGLVMVESMACGSPVIAFRKGSASEVIENEKTGFLVDDFEEMVNSLKKINQINRSYCRQYVAKKFGVETMVDNYLEAYKIAIKLKQFKNNPF